LYVFHNTQCAKWNCTVFLLPKLEHYLEALVEQSFEFAQEYLGAKWNFKATVLVETITAFN
jgi:malate synthase